MSDPIRTAVVSHPSAAGEREATIEALLLGGLDRYFASDYEQAIDVWSRVLFIDRGHARARAYIERARSALAEQHRESEELVHSGIAAFERGDRETARRLLSSAVARGGAHDVALAFLARINRVSPARAEVNSLPLPEVGQAVSLERPTPRRTIAKFLTATLAVCAGCAAAYLLTSSLDSIQSFVPSATESPASARAPFATPPAPLIVPRSSEGALDRARALFASGRLYDALRTLELVRPTDPLWADANRLKADIQRVLLADPSVPGSAQSLVSGPVADDAGR